MAKLPQPNQTQNVPQPQHPEVAAKDPSSHILARDPSRKHHRCMAYFYRSIQVLTTQTLSSIWAIHYKSLT